MLLHGWPPGTCSRPAGHTRLGAKTRTQRRKQQQKFSWHESATASKGGATTQKAKYWFGVCGAQAAGAARLGFLFLVPPAPFQVLVATVSQRHVQTCHRQVRPQQTNVRGLSLYLRLQLSADGQGPHISNGERPLPGCRSTHTAPHMPQRQHPLPEDPPAASCYRCCLASSLWGRHRAAAAPSASFGPAVRTWRLELRTSGGAFAAIPIVAPPVAAVMAPIAAASCCGSCLQEAVWHQLRCLLRRRHVLRRSRGRCAIPLLVAGRRRCCGCRFRNLHARGCGGGVRAVVLPACRGRRPLGHWGRPSRHRRPRRLRMQRVAVAALVGRCGRTTEGFSHAAH